MVEEWLDIDGYNGAYQISSLGRVKSLQRKVKCRGYKYRTLKERILSPKNLNKKDNYLCVCLSDKKTVKYFLVHRLVALAFIQNPHNKSQINHINGIRTDNVVSNLEWCDEIENMQNAKDRGVCMGEGPRKAVNIINIATNENSEYASAICVARLLNIPKHRIYSAIRRDSTIMNLRISYKQ